MAQLQTKESIDARPIEERIFDANRDILDGLPPVPPGDDDQEATITEKLFVGPPRRRHIADLSRGSDSVPVYDHAQHQALALQLPTGETTFVLPSDAESLSDGRVHPEDYQPWSMQHTGQYDLAFTDNTLAAVTSQRHGHLPKISHPKTIGRSEVAKTG